MLNSKKAKQNGKRMNYTRNALEPMSGFVALTVPYSLKRIIKTRTIISTFPLNLKEGRKVKSRHF